MDKKILVLTILVLFVIVVSGCVQPTPTPTCGDGTCDSGEQTTCPQDCPEYSEPKDIGDIDVDTEGSGIGGEELDGLEGELDISF